MPAHTLLTRVRPPQTHARAAWCHAHARSPNRILNSRAYLEIYNSDGTLRQAGCYPPQQTPPYEDLKAAFESATQLPEGTEFADYAIADCASNTDTTVTIAWAGQTYVVCQVITDEFSQFVGEGFVMDIEQISLTVPDEAPFGIPAGADGQPLQCEPFDATAAGTVNEQEHTARRLLHGEPIDDQGTLHPEHVNPWYLKMHPAEDSAESRLAHRRRMSNGKTCLFVPGLGQTAGATTSTFTSFWGNVHVNVASCSTVKFLHLDTRGKAWDSMTNMQAFCTEATGGSGSTISNHIIFSHGIGSNIVAAALHAGECSLQSSSSWKPVSGYFKGSAAGTSAASLCSSAYGGALEEGHLCQMSGGARVPTTTFASTAIEFTSPSLTYTGLTATHGAHADATMCATNSWGLNSDYSNVFQWIEDNVNGWQSGHVDGVMSEVTCQGGKGGARWRSSYSDDFYSGNINHADTTCMFGDGYWGNDRKPCKWFQYQV